MRKRTPCTTCLELLAFPIFCAAFGGLSTLFDVEVNEAIPVGEVFSSTDLSAVQTAFLRPLPVFAFGPSGNEDVSAVGAHMSAYIRDLSCPGAWWCDASGAVSSAANGAKEPVTSTPAGSFPFVGFASEQALEDYVRASSIDAPFSVPCAVWFRDTAALGRVLGSNTTTPGAPLNPLTNATAFGNGTSSSSSSSSSQVPLTVRCVASDLPAESPTEYTERYEELVSTGRVDTWKGYARSGFLAAQGLAQSAVAAEALLRAAGGGLNASEARARVPPGPSVGAFPRPEYVSDTFAGIVQGFLPFLLQLSLTLSVRFLASALVEEKEKNIRETLRVAGLGYWANWAAWLTSTSMILMPSVTIGAIISKVTGLFGEVDFFIIWFFFLLYILSVIVFGFLLSTFFVKVKTASTLSVLIFLLSTFPLNFFQGDPSDPASGPLAAKVLICLLSPNAFSFGIGIMSRWQGRGESLGWGQLGQGDLSMGGVMALLVLDLFLYVALAAYFASVLPSESGTPKHWLFCFGFKRSVSGDADGGSGGDSDDSDGHGNGNSQPRVTELTRLTHGAEGGIREEDGHDPSTSLVQIRALSKTYQSEQGEVRAVESVSLEIREGEIFGLLGHNGAGKSTLISMLCGATSPTSGDATIAGHSIVHDIDKVRKIIGLCPQHNALIDLLTVREHLELYAGLKGLSKAEAGPEIDRLIAGSGLSHKADALSKTLSGGMKRSLSTAIAFTGGSKLVVLDEASSGTDIQIARTIWSLIEAESPGRAIVLTTHTMAEADALSSRIAIMGEGRVRCVGSSLFLKRKYGVGYSLGVVRKPRSDPSRLRQLVLEGINGAKVEAATGTDISFALPFESSAQFAPVLYQIDMDAQHDGKEFGVESFAISATTLEHVFLAIADGAQPGGGNGDGGSGNGNANVNDDNNNAENDDVDDDGAGSLLNGSAYSSSSELSSSSSSSSSLSLSSSSSSSSSSTSAASSSSRYADDGAGEHLAAGGRGSVRRPSGGSRSGTPPNGLPSIDVGDDSARLAGARPVLSPSSGAQLRALMRKRYLTARRSKWGFFTQIVLPIVFLVIAIIAYKSVQSVDSASGERLDLSDPVAIYGSRLPLASSANVSTSAVTAFVSALQRGVAPSAFEARSVGDVDTLRGTTLIAADLRSGNPLHALALIRSSSGTDIVGGYGLSTASLVPGVDEALVSSPLGLVSVRAIHAAPALVSAMGTAQLQLLIRRTDVGFALENEPLPKAIDEITPVGGDVARMSVLLIYLPIVAFAFIPAFGAVVVGKEREDGVKHQQILAGVKPVAYWLSNFIVDALVFMFSWFASVIIVLAAPIQELKLGLDKFAFILLLFLYGMSSIPLGYLLSTWLPAKRANSMTLLFLIGGGFVTFITTTVIQFFGEFDTNRRNLRDVAAGLSIPFNLHPAHAVARGAFMIALQRSKEIALEEIPGFSRRATFDWDLAGCPTTFLIIVTVVSWSVLLFNEGSRGKVKPTVPAAGATTTSAVSVGQSQHPGGVQVEGSSSSSSGIGVQSPLLGESPDVATERARVERGRGGGSGSGAHLAFAGGDVEAGATDVIQVDAVDKRYPKVHAVNNLSFAVSPGEALALLGHNGAGKTTAMSIMTGAIKPTSGTVRIAGHDVVEDRTNALHAIGFAPQTNPLMELLTCREHFTLYANLHGFPAENVSAIVDNMIKRCDLSAHADKLSSQLSGGNKRKLSLGCAMICEPRVLISDEVTAGVDPAASRKLLSLLRDFLPGRSVVLSTHLLHEAEALCTRMAMMVDGVLRCIGTRAELTERFAEGYVIEASAPQEAHQGVIEFVTGSIRGARVEEVHGKLIRFQTQKVAIRIPELFSVMEANKERLGIVEYSLTQPNLESVFLAMSRQSQRNKEVA